MDPYGYPYRGGQGPTAGSQSSQYPTKLEQQLAGMHVGGGGYPTYGGGGQPQQQSPNYGGGHPGAPDYNYQNSYNAAPSQHSPGGYGSPTSAHPLSSGYGSPSSQHSHSSPGYGSPTSARPPPGPTSPPAMPDAVLNMAARGPPEKKPWAYAPDMDSIKEQRNKVRRRAPAATLPHYQNILNMPTFNESSPPGVPKTSPHPQPEPIYGPGPGEADVVHAQYNSPLDLYSQDNVADAFAGQTSGVITGVRGAGNQSPSQKGITDSPTWKMIQGMDAPKPRQSTRAPHEGLGRPTRAPSADDEITFTGINSPTDIPSKSFHRLQQNIGGSEVDTSSIRQNVSGDDEDDVGAYNEASIRYRGRNIPSKSFRMLQSMTGGAGHDLQVPQRGRKPRVVQQQEPEQDPDEIVDISYVGGNIPSRSFKILQQSVGETGEEGETQTNGYAVDGQTNEDHIQTSQPTDATQDPRRRRRRQRPTAEAPSTENQNTFDEDAYLAGSITTVRDSVGQQLPGTRLERTPERRPSWTREDDVVDTGGGQFDEDAYLSGQVSIMGGEPKVTPISKERSPDRRPSWQKDVNVDAFDEDAYLAGEVPIMGGEPKPVRHSLRGAIEEEKPDWQKRLEEGQPDQFDENAYLRGRIPLVRGGSTDLSNYTIPEYETEIRDRYEDDEDKSNEPFDEDAYLAGRVALMGGDTDRPLREIGNITPEPKAPWVHDDEPMCENEFDEYHYLLGRLPVAAVRQSVDRELSPSRFQDSRETSQDPRAPWEKGDDDDFMTDDEFDENAYLSGRGGSIVRGSVDREISAPAREYQSPRKYRERAPWERVDPEEDYISSDDPQFDENAYLLGRAGVIRTSVDRDMGQNGYGLNNSIYYGGGGGEGGYENPQEPYDPDKAYNDMVYVGNKIPSKTFLRLQRYVSKEDTSNDPLDRLRHRQQSREDEGLDVEDAVDQIDIEQHNPENYMEMLKKSVEESNMKIEIENEATDF